MDSSRCLVTRLFCLVADGVAEIDDPTLQQVIDALNKLDGVDCDTLSVTLRNGDSMDVGGGADDQYKCHCRTNGSFFDLVDPNQPRDSEATVSISMGEEINTFPVCCIVPLKIVVSAVEAFCTTGLLNNVLSWDNTLEYEPL